MAKDHRQVQRDRVVVVGAGFGGFQTAQSLSGANADVILIDRNNYSTFTPLIYQVATGQLEPTLVAYPIRTKLRGMKNVRFLQAAVDRIDFDNKLVGTHAGLVPYEYLVIATGTQPSYHGVPGAQEHTFTLKSLQGAIALRDHILCCFEQAAIVKEIEERQRLLTFVIVGGGATGVEVAGALAELLQGAFRRDFSELIGLERIVLVQSASSLLPEFSQQLGNYTHRKLERMGVEVHLNVKMAEVTAASATLSNQQIFNTATVVWAAGIQAAQPDLAQPVKEASKGKLVVRDTLQLMSHPNVYAIGDVAYFERLGKPLSGVAPEALQQGVTTAYNIRRQLKGKLPQPFGYWNKGRLAIVGGYGGVGRIAGIDFGSFGAWIMWLIVHLTYLPGYRNRLFVLLTWIQNYLLGDRAIRQVSSQIRHTASSRGHK
ncbi:NAD(P)/FAD-dependent oxidoreductase [Oscillatoria sp. CS-180]|uniref:NAD(P)/FAD-dependent oxidoreductase n=1 Tax=Oscillatoria sp. CS-180 TaxID=3021720 RepID=UPI00232AF512|nr:NAD(P)/FAD-dependent oxidoreductase [Oscillatoria sp. CS-180]MDB9528244.1 NAD(P)/FAD-dependent oxidoreductase [Oscillatoria sp. CS-180]